MVSSDASIDEAIEMTNDQMGSSDYTSFQDTTHHPRVRGDLGALQSDEAEEG